MLRDRAFAWFRTKLSNQISRSCVSWKVTPASISDCALTRLLASSCAAAGSLDVPSAAPPVTEASRMRQPPDISAHLL